LAYQLREYRIKLKPKDSFMKKLITVLCLAGLAIQLNAQKFTAGIKAGANISNFTGGNFEDVEKKALVGFHAGAYLSFGIGSIYIQPELLVSTAGAKFEDAGEDENFKLTYITLPVMLKYRSAGGFYIELGPQVGFKIGEDVGDQTIEDFAKNLDLSLGAGLGFQMGGGFGIGGRYLVGLSKVGDFEASSGVDPDFKNSVIQLGIFFALGGNKK
jgi:hypothetical protein